MLWPARLFFLFAHLRLEPGGLPHRLRSGSKLLRSHLLNFYTMEVISDLSMGLRGWNWGHIIWHSNTCIACIVPSWKSWKPKTTFLAAISSVYRIERLEMSHMKAIIFLKPCSGNIAKAKRKFCICVHFNHVEIAKIARF